MAALLPPAPVNPTGELAQHLPGYDPTPAIAAQEQSLQEFLNLPVKEILARLGLPPLENKPPDEKAPPPEEGQPQDAPPPAASPMDPSALISPVTDALGTLGSGLFEDVDPATLLSGISQAFQSTGGSLQKSLGSVEDAWQGASGTAAASKTATAIADGAEVGAQSDALRTNLTTATAEVAQARVRMIAIITEFQATMAAIGPSIIFPWGWAAAIAAANKAIASAAEVVTELQSSLGAKAAEVTTAGAPVGVTAAPDAAASPLGGLAKPLMNMAMKGAQAGIDAGTGAASAANGAAAKPDIDAPPPVGAGAGAAAALGSGRGGGGGGVGGGGGTPALRSIATSPMVQPETHTAPSQSTSVRGSGGAVGGMMGGPGMMGGAGMMGGQGANSSASNGHTAAAFLHTSDQGGEIVGDLGTAAPPVLGEADPTESPDIELRI